MARELTTPNPLEEDMWQQIREAYAIVDSRQADMVDVDIPDQSISVFQDRDYVGSGEVANVIFIKVVV